MKPKCYIFGPMTGYENYNFDAFDKAKVFLETQGFHVISPADLDRFYEGWGQYPPEGWVPTKADLIRFIDRDIMALNECSHAYGLEGWWDSKGARAEKAYAEWRGLTHLGYDILGGLKQ